MTTTPHEVAGEDEYFGEFHVYQPHRTGIPNIPVYVRELLKRRQFAAELSRSSMRAAHTDTFFGQLWLILNPLLLALVYYLLVSVLSASKSGHGGPGYLAHLCAGLFAFTYVASSITSGGLAVISGGKLILFSAFPRLLLPMSAVRTAFFRFLPTMAVYAVIHLLAGLTVNAKLLLVIPIMFLLTLFSIGLACLFSMLTVYFRDISSFLPYFIRIWLYISPVLFTLEDLHRKFANHNIVWAAYLNPLYSLLGMWSDLLSKNVTPGWSFWFAGTVWSVGTFVFGALLFMSRERDFAVRI